MENGSAMRSIINLIGFVLFFVAVFLILQRVDKFLTYKAIDDCSHIGRIEQTNADGSKAIYPVMDLYTKCLDRVGVK